MRSGSSSRDLDLSAGDLVSKISLTARQDMDSIKQVPRCAAWRAYMLLRGRRVVIMIACKLACAPSPTSGRDSGARVLSDVSQMASQASSKLSRMAQSFMRDLQGGY